MYMLISFSGAQSTGKSTLLEFCCVNKLFSGYHCVKEVTRKVSREQNVSINELGKDETQLFILSEHLHNHNIRGNALLDRCILDGLVYTSYLNKKQLVSDWVFEYAYNLYNLLLPKIDCIFYTSPEDIPLVDDGERSTDVQFRTEIIDMFDRLITTEKLKGKVFTLRGNVSERFEQVQATIKTISS